MNKRALVEPVRWLRFPDHKPTNYGFYLVAFAGGGIDKAPWNVAAGRFQHGREGAIRFFAPELTHPETLQTQTKHDKKNMSTNAEQLALRPNSQIAILEGALSIEQITRQRSLIEQAMKAAMKPELHYGKIPGSNAPSLLQPGAQLLCSLFRLRPEYEIKETDLPGSHKAYRVTCRLFLMGTEPPLPVGEGLGEASSMESKHRFRSASSEFEDTGEALPGAYWGIKTAQGQQRAEEWLSTSFDGKKVRPKKFGDEWRVVIVKGAGDAKIENPNPTDVHNTILKMAKKRAFVDATITATASSDFFTQDMEDIAANLANLEAGGMDGSTAKEKPAAGENSAGSGRKGSGQPKGVEKGQGGASGDVGGPIRGEEGTSPVVGNWREVKCHFGQENGPIKNKRLGDMPNDKLQWLFDRFAGKKEEKLSRDDRRLKAALAIWKAEHSTGISQTGSGSGSGSTGSAAETGEKVNLQSLSENLDYAAIDGEAFMRVARGKGWTSAESFAEITEKEAAFMVDHAEEVVGACRAEK